MQEAVPPEQLSVSTPAVQPLTVHWREWEPLPVDAQGLHVWALWAGVIT